MPFIIVISNKKFYDGPDLIVFKKAELEDLQKSHFKMAAMWISLNEPTVVRNVKRMLLKLRSCTKLPRTLNAIS